MGYLIRVTDVKVTSACNKERRNKIKLGREASLNPPPQNLFEKGGKKIIMSPDQARRVQKSTCREDHEFLDQQLQE